MLPMDIAVYKQCIKCHRILPVSDFYVHPRMKDGYLNKCKECCKDDMRKLYDEKCQDESWMEKERARGRDKYHRKRYKKTTLAKEKARRYPALRGAKGYWKRHADIPSGMELHHWNYNLPYDVIVLSKSLHSRLHSAIEFELERGIYSYQGELLDTLQKHLRVISIISKERGYAEPIEVLTRYNDKEL